MKNNKLCFRPSLDIKDGGVTESSHAKYIADKYRTHNRAAKFTPRQIERLRRDWDDKFKDNQTLEYRDILLREFTHKYNSSPQNLRLILSNRCWKSVSLCEYPYVAVPVRVRRHSEAEDRAFIGGCIKQAALEIALEKGIYNVRYNDVQERAGIGRIDRVYKKLDLILKDIEPEYVRCKYGTV